MTLKKKYVVHGNDDQDYEVIAGGYEVLDGALLFGDEKGDLVIAYSPSFWQYVSGLGDVTE